MSLDTITLEDALKLMSLPRVLGEYEGETITVQNGRYGPYLTKGADSRTLTSEDQLFSITLDEAIAIYKEPKVRRRGVAKPPLKDLGVDPASQRPVLVKDGRFGLSGTWHGAIGWSPRVGGGEWWGYSRKEEDHSCQEERAQPDSEGR
jgi:DNA topoisomerase-1